jgi:ATP-dependent DNA ligase
VQGGSTRRRWTAGASLRTRIATRFVSSAAPAVDHARRFRDIAAAISKLSTRTLVLDGEVVIFDEQLRSRFDWLREPDRAAVAWPPVYMAFDLLYRDGRDSRARPLSHRRVRLEGHCRGQRVGLPGAASRA